MSRAFDTAALDLYLDGLLEAEERAAFEARIAREPDLARELTRQRSVDARLVRAFTPPADPAAGARTALARAAKAAQTRFSGRRVGALAAGFLALALGVGWWWSGGAGTRAPLPPEGLGPLGAGSLAYADLDELYDDLTRRFGPEIESGASTCVDHVVLPASCVGDGSEPESGVGIRPGGTVLGPFRHPSYPQTAVLAAEVDGEPVFFLVVGGAEGQLPAANASGSVRLHRTALADLVVYELTPHDEPHCDDLLEAR